MNAIKLALILLIFSGCKEDNTEGNTMLVQFQQTVSGSIQSKNWVVNFQSIEENSLCPEDQTCIWQGRLVVQLLVNEELIKLGIGDLHTNISEEIRNAVVLNGTTITLVEAFNTEETSNTKIKLQFD